MKRWPRQALLFLLIGATINIAVAWAFELPTNPDYSDAPGSSFDLGSSSPTTP